MSAHGAVEVLDNQHSARHDSEPLLADDGSGILYRVVSGLHLPGAWRRMFPWPSGVAGGSEAVPAPDIECGERAASSGNEEQPAGTLDAACRDEQAGGAVAQGPAGELPGAGMPAAAGGEGGPPHSAAQSSHTAAGRLGDLERPGAAQAGASTHTEITAAETPPEGTATQEADASGIVVAAAFVREDEAGSRPGGEPVRSLTLGQRVASIGRDLLGLKKAETVSEAGRKAGESSSGSFKALLGGGGSESPPRSPGSQPTCLICLEPLMNEDFLSGEAISLDCQCRGEVALRHRTCAIKWSRVKGDAICDICRAPIKNLPTPSPRGSSSSESDMEAGEAEYAGGANANLGLEAMPGNADLVFDCIRVTWVAMIVCILFFSMDLSTALWTGIIVGAGYTLFVRAMYSQQMALAAQEAARQGEGASPVAPAAVVHGIPPPPFLHQMIV